MNQLLSGLICCILFFGCGKYKLEEENNTQEENKENNESKEYELQLQLASKDNTLIHYPLSSFWFNQKQACIRQQEIHDPDNPYTESLPKGIYHLSILSGVKENRCLLPSAFSPNHFISLPEEHYGIQSIEFGQADINVRQPAQVKITLQPAVAAVNFRLDAIPPEAKAVEVILSPVSSGISFKGLYSNDSQSCSIPCHRQGKQWQSQTLYLFPHDHSSTHISIKATLPGEDKVYSYTYQASLKPGYPYQFSGSFNEGIALNGNFQIEGWQPGIDVEFGFDEIKPDTGGNNGEGGGGSEEDTETNLDSFIVPQLPTEDSVWGYFYIWKMIPLSDKSAKAILIAPDQWYCLKEEGINYLSNYQVNEIQHWRMFSTEEAKQFRDQFRSQIDDLNYFLEQNGLDIFYYSEGGRYLCNNGQSTFSFINNRIINAGKTVKYYLRPIKTVLLKEK